MNREEILKKCSENDGTWEAVKNITFATEGADTGGVLCHIKVDDEEVVFWMMSHHKKLTDGIFKDNAKLETIAYYFRAAVILAAFFEIDLPSLPKPEIVTKEVATISTEHLKMEGKIEAYEKLLIGRDIQISK